MPPTCPGMPVTSDSPNIEAPGAAARAVTIVAHDIGPVGGMERQLSALIRGLLERGWEVTTIARRCELPPHPLLRRIRVVGPRRPFVLAYPWFFALGSIAVSRHRRGLLHTTGAIVLNHADVSTVHYCHHAARTRGDARRAGSRSLLKRVNATVAVWMKLLGETLVYDARRTRFIVCSSAGVADELRATLAVGLDRLAVIPNGVDTAAFEPDAALRASARRRFGIGERDFVALFLASDWERKGLRFAIEGVAMVPECRLLVVGRGDTARYRALAEGAGAADRVLFVGTTKELASCYSAADAFVLPTEYDSAPLALYEAAASGLPLVVTRMNGAEGVVEDGVSGWFVERDAHDIAARLETVQGNPVLGRELGGAARCAAARYTWESIVDQYCDLYIRCSSERSGKAGG